MKLSVIIVNYNVKYFLEQALLSAQKALQDIDGEIIVVDNNSVDDSVAMLKEKFPNVQLIANDDNPGFSKANNQAIKIAKGEYVLLLNPDTVVEEDTFVVCAKFMDAHPEAGGLGVKMIDGAGRFLPESKRGLPSPLVAFFKMFGLSWLFPKSKLFNHYHLGYLSENETHEIEVLAGAFMWLRKSVLDKIGLLDETFFMYGEDIDLSYRILKADYKNYYLPETKIIHYKGESTKKGSLNYVLTFYNAMIIFAKKHFTSNKAKTFTFLIRMAIFVRAGITLVSSGIKKLAWPILDFVIMLIGLQLIKYLWASNYYGNADYYPAYVGFVILPLYALFWVVSILYSGGYDKPRRIAPLFRGVLIGTLILAAVYGFLDLTYRSSRIILLMGTVWALLGPSIARLVRHFLVHNNFKIGRQQLKRVIIVGSSAEFYRTNLLLDKAGIKKEILGRVQVDEEDVKSDAMGKIHQLDEVARIHKANEIIFCSADISAQSIMEWMTNIGDELEYKILPEESESIIGSSSKNVAGELYTIDIQYQISSTSSRRNKRTLDIFISLILLIISWLIIWFLKNPLGLFRNIFAVIFGKKSWVGYTQDAQAKLPKIKQGVLSPLELYVGDKIPEEDRRLDFYYARDFVLSKDLEIIWKGWKGLGGN